MIEAKDSTDNDIDFLASGHVLKVLERDRRNNKADRGRFLKSWRRTPKFTPSSNIACCYDMPYSRNGQGKE